MTPRARRRAAAALAVLVLAVPTLTACRGAADSAAGNGLPTGPPSDVGNRIRVVAAESLWGNLVGQIGGSRVSVTSILSDPGQDPHEYTSGVGDAVAVAAADLVVVNGAGYDPFMNRLLSADPRQGRSLLTLSSAVGLAAGANPHLWYSPTYVAGAAKALATALIHRDPGHAATYRAGLRRAEAALTPLHRTLATIAARHRGALVGYTEPVPAYLVQAAHLRLGTPAAFSRNLENGSDPTPADSAHFEQAVTSGRVGALLLNTQVGDAETQRLAQLARRHHVPVVSVSETLPRGTSLQRWQDDQAHALLAALDG